MPAITSPASRNGPHRLRARIGAALLATLWLACGCQTTGDPRQGGLFGWSEDKAQARAAALQASAASANEVARRERESQATLTDERRSADLETRSLQIQLEALEHENDGLEQQLRNLRARNEHVGGDVAKRLRELDDEARSVPPSKDRSSAARVDALDTRNRKLHEVLLLMLQR